MKTKAITRQQSGQIIWQEALMWLAMLLLIAITGFSGVAKFWLQDRFGQCRDVADGCLPARRRGHRNIQKFTQKYPKE